MPIVLGSPVNCGNVTAIFRKFMERLLGVLLLAVGAGSAQVAVPNAHEAVLVASSGRCRAHDVALYRHSPALQMRPGCSEKIGGHTLARSARGIRIPELCRERCKGGALGMSWPD